MKKGYILVSLIVLLLVLALAMAACGGTTTTTAAGTSSTAVSTETTAASTDTTVASTDTTAASTDTTAASTDTTAAAGPATGEPIKIGFLNDITGPAAMVAGFVSNGVAAQVEYVNAHGGINGRPLQVITFDSKSDTTTAVAGVKKLVNDDKVSMIIGPFTPYEQEPCRLLADQLKTPLLDFGPSTLDQITAKTQHQWGFGLTTGPISQGKTLLQVIKDNGWKKLIGIQDVLGIDQDALKYLKQNEAANGYSLTILPDIIQLTTTDYQPFLNKIMAAYKAEKPDAIVLMITSLGSPPVYKGMRALGVTVPVLTSPSADSPQVFALGPEAVEGLMLIDNAGIADPSALPDSWPLKAGQLEFAQRYQAKFNKPADFFASEGADAITAVAAAMKQAGGDDKAKVQQAMLNLKGVVGYTGIIGFSPSLTAEGIQGPFTEWQIKGGKYVLLKTFE